jgi:hypothetical protein
MDKIYLLLRNNLQTGPLTIDELWQQQLRPSDMIWIEGKSTAWAHLSEMELNPSILPETGETEAAEPAADEIERKAEALRHRALSFRPHSYQPETGRKNENVPTQPALMEANAIDFIDHRTEKKNAVAMELVLTLVVVGVFAIGIYKGRALLNQKKEAPASVATQLLSGDQNAAKSAPDTASLKASGTLLPQDSISVAIAKPRVRSPRTKPDSLKNTITAATNVEAPVSLPVKTQEDIKIPPTVKLPAEIPAKEIVVQKEKSSTASENETQEKKKTLGEAFKSIFKKKQKDDAPKTGKDQ